MRMTFLGALALGLIAAASAPADAGKAKYELKIATLAPKGTGWEKVLKEYEKKVEKATDGEINVRVFYGGTMYDDENYSVEMLVKGDVQGVGGTTGAVATVVTALETFEIPFLFATSAEADYVLDKHVKDKVKDLFAAKGLVFGFWSENGFRHFGSSWGPVLNPSDLDKKAVRAQESYPHIEMWKALGASYQAIPTGDVPTSLKGGSVKGFDQSLLYTTAGGWYSHITDFTLSAHIYQPAVITFNKAWFDKLPAEYQTILVEEGEKLVRKGRKAIRDANKKLVKIIEDAGVKVHTLDATQRKAFVTKTAGVRKLVAKRSSDHQDLLTLIEAGLKEYKGKAKKGK